MLKMSLRICLCLFLLFPSFGYAENVLRIGGVGSGLPTIKLIAEAFKKYHPGVRIEILPSLGSTGGIKAVLDGVLDIGLSGRSLKDTERAKGAILKEYAYTPFVFVANMDTPVSCLSTKELVEIYEGKKKKWPDDSIIRLVLRPESDVDTKIIRQISPEMDRAVTIANSREGMIVAVRNQDSDEAVAGIPGTIGASTLAQVIPEKRRLNVLCFNGIQPNLKTLANGTYPLVKHLFLVTTNRESEIAKKFIAFIFSPKSRRILSENGSLVPRGK